MFSRKSVKVQLKSILTCNYEMAVININSSALLHHVAYPLVTFSPDERTFPERWSEGTYWSKIYLFGFLPFGKQAIVISFPKSPEFCLRDNGYSFFVKRWDHFIYVKKISESQVSYEDEVEIRAGVLTPIVWLFALMFYSHRQGRLRKLAQNSFKY